MRKTLIVKMTAQAITQLVRQFSAKSLPKSAWTHQAHLVVAFWHNWHFDFENAFKQMKTKIIAYNEAVGTTNTDTAGYHESLTRFWMIHTKNYLLENKHPTLEIAYNSFLKQEQALKTIPLKYYSKTVLFSTKARKEWINGDLQKIESIQSAFKYNKAKLIQQVEQDIPTKFLLFWGHSQKEKGQIDKSCFSQWYPSEFEVAGISYSTAEHWMMAKKATLFQDDKIYQQILRSKTPGEAKKLGRKVANFDPAVWDAHKYEIVVNGNVFKFTQNPTLKDFLLNTKKRVLAEASPYDRIWGIGMTQNNPKSNQPSLWRGENLLGFALMEARDRLK